ncbi:hypothetical protein [Streptomyces sp. NPDC050428]|uniref:hypothetical protein n=1 Tax=Streptomyces sp. NPDC050428 TaxID=3155757 RepID=UPI00341FDD83
MHTEPGETPFRAEAPPRERALVPLRIPSGWAVLFNIFVEFPDDDPPTPAEVSAYLSEDILLVQPVSYTGSGWAVDTDPSRWFIDLGWYSSGDPDGTYRLCLVRDGWNEVPVRFEHRDCHAVQKAFNTLTAMLAEGSGTELIARVLDDPRFLDEGSR